MTEYEIKRLEDRIRELWNEKEGLLKENAELEKVCQDLSDKFDYQVKQVMKLENELEKERNLNTEIKARFVKCNTCTDEMKSKCLMFSENLCEGERCEELIDLMALVNKSDLQKENEQLKEQIEKMKCCANCKSFKGYGETCEGWGEPVLNLTCDCTEWELRG